MIIVKSVKKSFSSTVLLEDITFQVERKERLSIVGPGGCGKTTLLKMILGLFPPDEGEITLMGQDMVQGSYTEKQLVLKKIGMAFQQGGLFDFMTVEENLVFAMMHMTEKTPPEMEEKVKEVLDGVKLAKTGDKYPFELSGGMKRRVGVARALATEPEVAIFDEPTSGLDPVTSTIILNMILDMAGKNKNITQLIATSNVEIALRFAERLLVINEGRVAADGYWRELLLDGPEWVRHFLSVRLIGLDLEYAYELGLPKKFIETHWK